MLVWPVNLVLLMARNGCRLMPLTESLLNIRIDDISIVFYSRRKKLKRDSANAPDILYRKF